MNTQREYLDNKLIVHKGCFHFLFIGLAAEVDEGAACIARPGEGFKAAAMNSWAHLVVTETFFRIFTLLLVHLEL